MSDITGSLSGIITDNSGKPIENAIVKLLSTSYDPLRHVKSDINGRYSIGNIIPDNYNLLCIANGTTIKPENNISITANSNNKVDFKLIVDPSMDFSLLMGNVQDSSTKDPISEANIFLYKIDSNNKENLVGMVNTNNLGSFVFPKLKEDNYILYVNALGYDDYKKNISINENKQMLSIDISLVLNSIKANGTVSGVIRDNNDTVIIKGDVILYKVEPDNSLTPIAFTKTNKNGVYLFSNVPKGDYKVKANEFKMSENSI